MAKIIGICGYSGCGKTTLLKTLIPQLKALHIRLAVIKHSHHDMEIDIPGKDSYELRHCGADQIIVASDKRWAIVCETAVNPASLKDLVNQFTAVDVVLVEGFKNEPITKIVCHRQENNKPLFYDENTIAIASDIKQQLPIRCLDLNNSEQIALFIKQYLNQLA